ncbi:hypothetical protein ABT282_07290 [Streptomyces sp. NPDC000927]|uniref:hypothetical protein n=1 Tax=Streptomyces sp. NPDC000927 TaxID=3154371 RepID=UPI003333E622
MDIYDRMKINVPPGEVRGMCIAKFEVVHPDDWTDAHQKRKDVVSPLSYWCMERDNRAPKPGWYTRLSEGREVWMSDTTAERRDHAEPVFMMSTSRPERVIINGLGLGMVLAAALTFDSVKRVDVVERDDRVIELVGPYYLKDDRVRIHHADALEQMGRWGADARWDVGWTDIWPDISAGNLGEMKQFTDFYGARCGFHGNWSEGMAKRSAWDNRHWDDEGLRYLSEVEVAQFSEEDEENESFEW